MEKNAEDFKRLIGYQTIKMMNQLIVNRTQTFIVCNLFKLMYEGVKTLKEDNLDTIESLD